MKLSVWQAAEQPSPAVVPPSSQLSPRSTRTLPQTGTHSAGTEKPLVTPATLFGLALNTASSPIPRLANACQIRHVLAPALAARSASNRALRACSKVGSQPCCLRPSVTSWSVRLLPPLPPIKSGSKPYSPTKSQYISQSATAHTSPTPWGLFVMLLVSRVCGFATVFVV